MPPHQQRVVEEKKDLDEKIAKLKVFLVSTFFTTLPYEERCRLHDQADVMDRYSAILGYRIAAFKP